jgi:outer membrane receptor for ferrienterochelin and colicin
MNEHRGRNGLKVAGAVALALAAASAGAQTAGTNLEEVIVTAQKRSQNVMNVPSAVSVVAQSQLENFHVTQLSDVAGYVPGLQVTSLGTPGQQFVSLRGIAPISPGANVGSYIDETPLGSSGIFQRETQFQVDLLPYDVERMEVLRGPQGTLYGAGAMGGLIKYVTRLRIFQSTSSRPAEAFPTLRVLAARATSCAWGPTCHWSRAASPCAQAMP